MHMQRHNKNPGSITARVTADGVLWVDQPHMFLVGKWLHRDNWHVGDFNLFWSDIRDNVHDRVTAAGEEHGLLRGEHLRGGGGGEGEIGSA